MSPRYIVMTSAAPMPRSCWGKYRRVALVELEPGFEGTPRMISPRARGVARIVHTWERLHAGGGERTAYARAMRAATAWAEELADLARPGGAS